ncbi:MAG: PSD1 domain-containing protein, partial [Pirellulaceae bacterium]|nr:PSD1 domain-containing protein [Pirellulaceae bacterium]
VVFSRDIRPILAGHCFKCHGPDEATREADLRLDTEDGARRAMALDGGITKLIKRVTTHDLELVMPPPDVKKPLTQAQIQLLTRWVEADAPWGSHWAFEPLVRPEIPKSSTKLNAPQRNPIDQFVQARLSQRGVTPSPEASRETLIRRVTLDLTGLPPTPAEVDAFVRDTSDNAWETVVDRLLKSPSYGERMAWNWLDAARYADSNGYQGDNERTMWPWRDWVVNAFNRNMPYDDFTIWQLAGDLMPEATFEQKLATGFLRNHMINGEGGRIAEENRVEYVMDMTETTGTIWLGLTLNCCRCHDHKFDPLSQQDYYKMSAFFNQTPVDGSGRNAQTPPVLEVPNEQQRQKETEIQAQLAALRQTMRQREQELAASIAAWEMEALSKAVEPAWQPFSPVHVSALHQELVVQPDGSILASGKNPRNDTYTLKMNTSLQRITALRLDALNHDSHTQGGLSRSDSGNFVLTEIEISVEQPGGDKAVPLKIASAEATFEQGDLKVSRSFDGDPKTGWAVYAGKSIDRPHSAVFYLAEPFTVPKEATMTIILRHDSPHVSHNIGRFRLSASGSSEAKLNDSDDSLVSILKTPADQRTEKQRDKIVATQRAADPAYAKLEMERKDLDKSLKDLRGSFPKVMVMQDMPETRKTWVLTRGVYSKHAEEVSADTPAKLPKLADGVKMNRLALARWIVSDDNPLTARVTVNRFWQQFFGIGLVKTPEDFGVQGEIPLQQDLLDWLAADFRENGWDVKRLIRQIVTSHTFRQSSRLSNRTPETEKSSGDQYGMSYEDDPENRFLSRGPRFRISAWMLRDQALAASGLMVSELGGPSVNGYQPAGVWEEATFGKKSYVQDQGGALYRRSLYTFWRRIIAPTMFFDNATRQTCTVKSFRTNTPLHALLTLNDVTFVESARALAERVLQEDLQQDEARIDSIFRRLVARPAKESERAILLAAIGRSRGEFQADKDAARKLLAMGESKRNEQLDPIEHAAWTSLTMAVMNLDETLTKE